MSRPGVPTDCEIRAGLPRAEEGTGQRVDRGRSEVGMVGDGGRT